jgi:hypothetical protein
MGFSWISSSLYDEIEDSVMDEIQANLKILYETDLDIGVPEWSFDADEGDEPLESHMDEIKAVVDYAHDRNYCRSHFDGHKVIDNSAYNVSKDAAEDASVYSGHNTTKQETHYTSKDATHYTNRLYSHNELHDGNYHAARQEAHYSDQEISKQTNVRTHENYTECGQDYNVVFTSYLSSDEAGYNKVLYYGVCTGQWSCPAENSTYYTEDYSTQNIGEKDNPNCPAATGGGRCPSYSYFNEQGYGEENYSPGGGCFGDGGI